MLFTKFKFKEFHATTPFTKQYECTSDDLLHIKMDTLENNVRSECKQAFAELQTDMSDLTMDLEVSGIPLLDHRTYVIKVFFPGQGDHRLLLDPRLVFWISGRISGNKYFN